jgi:hypothetical protein
MEPTQFPSVLPRFCRWSTLVSLCLLTGCFHDSQFSLAPDSPIPKRWKDDPRTREWKHFAITYCFDLDNVTVTASDQPWHGGSVWRSWRGLTDRGISEVLLKTGPDGICTMAITLSGLKERYELRPARTGFPYRALYLVSDSARGEPD